ncbi:MAG: hypothetical protein K6E51_13100 [Treponema sp.]|nr:hypothetical protein [Treponema sp.]
MSSSPEVQKKKQLRKIDVELRAFQPVLYKNNMLQPNFAQTIKELYIHTKPIDDLFLQTISNPDVRLATKFSERLFISGYSPNSQDLLATLSYEKRKAAVFASTESMDKTLELQKRTLNRLLGELENGEFKKIDIIMADMYQFADFCHFNFMSILKAFDRDFDGTDLSYVPSFQEILPLTIERNLTDFYFIASNLRLTNSLGNLLCALLQIRNHGENNTVQRDALVAHLKAILYILDRVLTKDIISKLIFVAKNDPDVKLDAAVYKKSIRQSFATHLKEYYEVDEERIKREIKDETTATDIKTLFGTRPLDILEGYNAENNEDLQGNTPVSFMWITPLQIVKSFLQVYLTESVKALLNDIVIEGFFENPAYKTKFSSTVFACTGAMEDLINFEKTFGKGAPNDIAVIKGYINDSHGDSDFMKKLVSTVDAINLQARALIKTTTDNLYILFVEIGDLLADAKKPSSEIISNLKVLMMSSRNRNSTDILEHQYGSWNIFFDIMQNYTVISKGEVK